MEQEKEYHILSLSGGKDSTALAFYIKENMPDIHEKIEYVFCDTGVDLPETYDYLNKIEIFLDKKITRIHPEKSFEHLVESSNGFLPSIANRWCTSELKTLPFLKYIKSKLENNSKVYNYIGFRADEPQRAKRIYDDPENLFRIYPFVENGLNKNDIVNILMNSGILLPDYYKWKERSSCYFCFFQNPLDWIKLYENHPNLYKKAMNFEKKELGWLQEIRLKDLCKPQNIKFYKEKYKKLEEQRAKKKAAQQNLNELLA